MWMISGDLIFFDVIMRLYVTFFVIVSVIVDSDLTYVNIMFIFLLIICIGLIVLFTIDYISI